MKKVTAVQFLIQNIVEDQTIKAKSMSEWVMVFEKVKQMERQQNEDTFYNARENKSDCQIWNCEGSQKTYETFEQYYNQTYKSE
jgi:hypothetical protein